MKTPKMSQSSNTCEQLTDAYYHALVIIFRSLKDSISSMIPLSNNNNNFFLQQSIESLVIQEFQGLLRPLQGLAIDRIKNDFFSTCNPGTSELLIRWDDDPNDLIEIRKDVRAGVATASNANPDNVNDDKGIEYLLSLPQCKQRTSEWYEARHKVTATASEVSLLLPKNYNNTECKAFLNKKANLHIRTGDDDDEKRSMQNIAPIRFGIQFEPIAQTLFQQTMKPARMIELGLLLHPRFPNLLGASPDGVYLHTTKSTIACLEIKCRYNKELKGEPTEANWHQMQAQMSVLGVNEASFLDCYFSRVCESDYSNRLMCTESCENLRMKGAHCTGKFARHGDDDSYIYAPPTVRTCAEFDSWFQNHKIECQASQCILLYYHVDALFHRIFEKEESWEQMIFPQLEKATLEIVSAQNNQCAQKEN